MRTRTVLLVALLAALLGGAAGVAVYGPGALLHTRPGQAIALWLADREPAPAGVTVAREGDLVPPLQLPDLDGRPVALPGAWVGRPLLVNVWATWCAPCLHELPELQRFAATQGADGVQVVGIALDDAALVRDFLQRVPVRYPILIDAPGRADAGVVLGNPKGVLPYSVLIGADGRVLRRRVGPFEPGELDGFVADAR
ncbi:MAG: TlpA family protein disulfide reductase [Xanthomonadales bacterium]|nr:TlpA family protein disulfide reductase [Xanthomonadales bacterium]